ncbi:M17 family peptidase N-terminal domain-containing protein, partial [Brevundimonas denitrificans]
MKFAFSEISIPKRGSLAVPVLADTVFPAITDEVDSATGGVLKRAIENSRFKGKAGEVLEILAPNGLEVSRVVLFGLGDVKEITQTSIEDLGGTLVGKLNSAGARSVTVILDGLEASGLKESDLAARVAFGAMLGNYRFTKYKTEDEDNGAPTLTR